MIFYKYTSTSSAINILDTTSLKFSYPKDFNDPYDTHTPSPLGKVSIEEHLDSYKSRLCFYLRREDISNEQKLKLIPSKFSHIIKEKEYGIESLLLLADTLENTPISKLIDEKILIKSMENAHQTIKEIMEKQLILCLSSKEDNILMWSHYGNNHSGVVLGFKSKNQESLFRTCKPVTYVTERPSIYNADDFFRDDFLDFADEVSNRIIYTKSQDWSYEKEFRIVIHTSNDLPLKSNFLTFYPEDLHSITFGCKCPEDQIKLIKSLATKVNHEVLFLKMEQDINEFKLNKTSLKENSY